MIAEHSTSFHTAFDNLNGAHPVEVVNTKVSDTLVSVAVRITPKAIAAFPTIDVNTGVNIQADPTNSDSVTIGARQSLAQGGGYVLEPGDSVFLEINNLNLLAARTPSGSNKVNVLGS